MPNVSTEMATRSAAGRRNGDIGFPTAGFRWTGEQPGGAAGCRAGATEPDRHVPELVVRCAVPVPLSAADTADADVRRLPCGGDHRLRRARGRPRPGRPRMTTNRSAPSPTVVPVLVYPDVAAAVAWLTDAFGFR